MNLLFVANFGGTTGYAWSTIGRVFDRLAEALRADGIRSTVCAPPGDGGDGSDVAFDYAETARSPAALWRFLRLLRRRQIGILYLTDQPTWSWRYPFFRLAGVQRIIVHDRTSGVRSPRGPLAQALKRLAHRVPWLAADRFVGISDFVTQRLTAVNGTPPARTHRVYNGIELDRFAASDGSGLRSALGLPDGRAVVFASGRAQPYKGIPVLIEAAALLGARGRSHVAFAYCGDGPALADFRRLAAERGLSNFHFLGRRDDVPRLIAGAAIAVVPSVWAEGFGLTVVEAMAAGVPVIASRIGGIPELIEDGVTGVLVTPGNAAALADALERLLRDESGRRELGERARAVARARFGIDRTVATLRRVVLARRGESLVS